MLFVVWSLLATFIIITNASTILAPLPVNPGGIGGLFHGPNSETIIKGPDGSVITSAQLGGVIETRDKLEPIVVQDVETAQAPLLVSEVSSVSTLSPPLSEIPSIDITPQNNIQLHGLLSNKQDISLPIPVAVQETPVVVNEKELHLIETEVVDAPDIEPNQNSDLKGPSGSISVRGSSSIISGPASTTISEPKPKLLQVAVPNVELTVPVNQHINTVVVSNSAILPSQNILPPLTPAAVLSTDSSVIASTPISVPQLPEEIEVSRINLGSNIVTSNSKQINYLSTLPNEANIPQNLVSTDSTLSSTLAPILSSSVTSNIDISNNNIILEPNSVNTVSSNGLISRPLLLNQVKLSPNGESENTIRGDLQQPLIISTSAPSTIPDLTNNPLQIQGLGPVSSNINQLVSGTSHHTSGQLVQNTLIANQGLVNQESVGSLNPIPAVLDTVLIEPSDPKNREYLNVGGTRLESVGKIVPIVQNQIVLQNRIPSTLTFSDDARYKLNIRYGRQTKQIGRAHV